VIRRRISNIREKYYINKLTIDDYKLTIHMFSDVTESSIETKRQYCEPEGKTLRRNCRF
jgi:hypothetical protein